MTCSCRKGCVLWHSDCRSRPRGRRRSNLDKWKNRGTREKKTRKRSETPNRKTKITEPPDCKHMAIAAYKFTERDTTDKPQPLCHRTPHESVQSGKYWESVCCEDTNWTGPAVGLSGQQPSSMWMFSTPSTFSILSFFTQSTHIPAFWSLPLTIPPKALRRPQEMIGLDSFAWSAVRRSADVEGRSLILVHSCKLQEPGSGD